MSSPPAEDPVTPPPMTTPPRKASVVRLQERRGSNLSLLLDVSSLGAEPVCSVTTPKEVWLQLLHTSTRPLDHQLLQEAAADTSALNVEYQKIPPNFVSAAELDVPGHTMKDRYKTILPNPESRVVLRSPEEEAGPDRYINANYIRVSTCRPCLDGALSPDAEVVQHLVGGPQLDENLNSASTKHLIWPENS